MVKKFLPSLMMIRFASYFSFFRISRHACRECMKRKGIGNLANCNSNGKVNVKLFSCKSSVLLLLQKKFPLLTNATATDVFGGDKHSYYENVTVFFLLPSLPFYSPFRFSLFPHSSKSNYRCT